VRGDTVDHVISPLIVCDNLVKIYKVAELEVVALQGLDLVVAKGEILGFVGASGSGKTTLMNILGGLDRPSAGRIWVDGQDLLKLSEPALDQYRRSKVGFVWQQSARNLIPYLSALDNVKLPQTVAGTVGKRQKQRAHELLDVVGLAERRDHKLSELSGGEQQRVSIAVALANYPSLLLADEPTGEVDEENALKIYQNFKRLNDLYGLTILIVSHDPGLAMYTHRVVAIQDGKIATETIRHTSSETKNDPESESPEDKEEEVIFDELVMLDSTGRLQVPKEYIEEYQIQGRVRLEPTSEGILILPVENMKEAHSAGVLADNFVEMQKKRAWQHRLSQWWAEIKLGKLKR
jgi:ABC-type lipoprotein export system ATPase subunit